MSTAEHQDYIDRELAKLGCTHSPGWGPPDARVYVVAPVEGVRQFWRGDDVLLVMVREGIHVDWALMDWAGSNDEGVRHGLVMRGAGPSSSLREPRHTYFGPDAESQGYLFYVKPRLLAWAFDCLREWFDYEGDEP